MTAHRTEPNRPVVYSPFTMFPPIAACRASRSAINAVREAFTAVHVASHDGNASMLVWLDVTLSRVVLKELSISVTKLIRQKKNK